MKRIKELYLKHREVIDYLFWGAMTTVVSFVTYSLFVLLFDAVYGDGTISLFGLELSLTVTLANILSWVCAVLFAFVTNKLWVFRSKSWRASVALSEFAKFLSARIVTGILEMAAVPLLVALGLDMAIFGIDGAIAKGIVTVLVIILNYIFSKLFIFKNKKPDSI